MRILGTILVLFCLAAAAEADQYPSHAVRVIVAAPPGGLTDIVARSVSQFLHEKYGEPFVVENVAGASSTIGAMQVARSTPDGYTLLVNPSLFVITPMLMKTQYDVLKDFTPVSNFGTVPLAIGVNPDIPAKNIQEFIALAKASPDKFTWGSEGVGSVGHLTMERLMREGDFKILVVQYKGTSPALIDLMAGRVSAMVSPVPNLIEQFRSGKVRPIAVTTETRLTTLPNVPTLEESRFSELRDRLMVRALGTGRIAPQHSGDTERRRCRSSQNAQGHGFGSATGSDPGRVELGRFRCVPERRDREVSQDHH